MYDLLRAGIKTRLTFETGSAFNPDWSPDGKTLVFSSNSSGTTHIYEKAADGTGDTAPLVVEERWAESQPLWSLDGRYLLFSRTGGRAQAGADYSVWALPLFGDHKPFIVLKSSFILNMPALSADGKWLAYRSVESGIPQVYIAPFEHGSGKWEVSTNGGLCPKWRRNGRELFYLSLDNKMMSVDIAEQGSSLSIGQVKALFQSSALLLGQTAGCPYDVTADRGKFLAVTSIVNQEATPLTLVTNWPALLKK